MNNLQQGIENKNKEITQLKEINQVIVTLEIDKSEMKDA